MVTGRFLLLLLALAALGAADPAPAPVPSQDYHIFPGDLIAISVFGHGDLHVEARVPVTGDITFPLIGNLVDVAGRAPEELAKEITTRLADGFVRNPSVQVQVREYGPRVAWVVGAVHAPGAIRLDPLLPANALQVISAAGGYEDDADRGAVQVVINDPQHPGGKLSVPLPPGDAGGAQVPLHHGDVVVVPRADRIFVLGQVANPRAVPVPARETLTVSKAISLAGGFARFAKESRVQVVRAGEQPLTVDVRAVLDGSEGAVDPQLKAGDTVFVPESRF